MKVIVVTPTYNEAENIERLIEAVQVIGKNSGCDLHQLIVDDNSPDHTGELVKSQMRRYPKLHLISGNKAGLGKAYVRGFRYAMDQLQADVLIEMDADFSHDPAVLPKLLKEIDKGYDLVIGSRYVSGGSVPPDWGFFRKLNSYAANLIARFIAGIYQIKDVTAGFKAIRVKDVADKVNWEDTKAQGYSFQLMGDYYILRHTNKVKEIPIQFVDRELGLSKVGVNLTYLRDIFEFIRNAWYLRAKRTETLIKFLIVGTSGAIINIVLWRALLYYFPQLNFGIPLLGLGIAQFISGEVSVVTNYIFNNAWTFGNRDLHHSGTKRFIAYLISATVAVFIQVGVVIVLGHFFGAQPRLRYPIIGIIIATAWNFLISNHIIFRERKK